jgi:hypothetical protein
LPNRRDFVPRGTGTEKVAPSAVRQIAMEVLVDNVRGQAPHWQPDAVEEASIDMRRLRSDGGRQTIEYTGRVRLRESGRAYDAALYGQGVWNASSDQFEALDLVVVGTRTGASRFNQRENDRGPAPMGITLSLFTP